MLVGGGIWAATSFFGSGPQPAEALPDSTIGYASIDLDPSGGQKIEAVKTLRKFPAFKDQIDLNTDDDIREKLFDEIQKDANCEGLDYADDIEPWLGDRAAVAAVDTGEDQPTPVLVVQVKDADKAEDGLAKIQDCAAGEGGDSSGGWAIEGDWAVVAETDKIAQGIADDAAEASLADDEDYQKWTDEVGDAGIISMYAAPEAGAFLADGVGGLAGLSSSGSATSCLEAGSNGGQPCDDMGDMGDMGSDVPSEMSDALKDFKGMAATVRFNDGALELEVAGDPGVDQQKILATDRGDDALGTLPDDTAAAIGVGFDEGWFSDMVEQMASYSGGEMSAADMMEELSNQLGLELPGDVETLTGDSMALAISSDFDPETFFNSSDGSGVPLAAKVKGDPEAIESVLDKLRAQMGPDATTVLGSDTEGDMVAVGPDPDYLSEVLKDGSLGDSDVFEDVVPEAGDASAIFFINFDAGDGWLVKAAGDDPQVADNLEPLGGLGLSAWQEDDASHALLRITTN